MELDNELREKFKDGAVGSIYGAIFGRPWITLPLVGLVLMIILGLHDNDYKFMLIAGGVFAAMLTTGIFFELHRIKERRRTKEQHAAMAAELRENYLTHWTVQPAEWRDFGVALLRRHWLMTAFLVVQLVVQSGYAWFGNEEMLGRNAGLYTNLLIISFALTTLVAQGLLTDIGKAFTRMKPTDVYIGEHAALVGGQLYSWAAAPFEFHAAMEGNPTILTLRLTGSSAKSIVTHLIKSFTVFGGAITNREWTARLPVPSGREGEVSNALRRMLRPAVIASALRKRAAATSTSALSSAGYSRAFVDFEGEISKAKNGIVSGTITNKHNFTVNKSEVTFNAHVTIVNLTQNIEVEGECLLGKFTVKNFPMANRDKIEVRFFNNDGSAAATAPILAHVNEDYKPAAVENTEDSRQEIEAAIELRLTSPRVELRSQRLPLVLLLLCYGFGAYTIAADYLWYRGSDAMRLVAPLRNEVLRPESWALTSINGGTGTPFEPMLASAGLAFMGFIFGGFIIAGFERIFKLRNSKLSGVWFMLMIAFAVMGAIRGLFFPELTTILNTETRNVEITEWEGIMPDIAAIPSTVYMPFDSIAGFLPRVNIPVSHRANSTNTTRLSLSLITKGGRRYYVGATEVAEPQTKDDSLSLLRRALLIAETLDSVVGAKGVPKSAMTPNTTSDSAKNEANTPPDSGARTKLLTQMPEDSIAVSYIVRCDTTVEIAYTAPFDGGFLSTKKTKAKGVWKFGFKATAGAYLSVIVTTAGYASVPATIDISLDGKRFRQQTSSMGLVSADGQIPLKKNGK